MCPHGLDIWHLIADAGWFIAVGGVAVFHYTKHVCYCWFCKLIGKSNEQERA